MRPLVVVPVVFALALLRCSSGTAVECRAGADCASGACDVNGRCVPVGPSMDAGLDANPSPPDAADGSRADAPADAPQGGDGGLCTPKNDGTITRDEVPMLAGLHATFVIAENVTFDTTGMMQPDGSRIWDLSAALPGDHMVVVTTDSPSGQWFSAQFTSATYTTRLSDTQPLLGVFQGGTSALYLQGVVSPASGSMQTELTYNPAVTTLSFPMTKGASWSSNAMVTGTADGVPAAYTEGYQQTVDVTGKLTTPFSTFNVQRVKIVLTRTVGVTVSIIRTYAFVTECFGTIASLTSQVDEPNDEFSNIAEARRLAP